MHHAPHTRLGAGIKQRDRRVLVHCVDGARTAVAQHPHGVDHGIDTR